MTKLLFAALALTMTASVAAAQSGSGLSQRFEVTFGLGVAQPSVVIEEPGGLRTPPVATETGDSHRIMTSDVSGRVWWSRRLSTAVGFSWSSTGEREYDFPRPPSPPSPPFSTYRSHVESSYRDRLISLSQAFDLPLSKVVVPFVAAGVELRSVVREESSTNLQYSDSTFAFDADQRRTGSQQAIFGAAGIRALVGRHGVAFVDGSLFFATFESELTDLPRAEGTQSVYGHLPFRWRAGAGVRF